MAKDKEAFEHVRQVKATYQDTLMAKANVVGVGIGFPTRAGKRLDEFALIVMVSQKLSIEALDPVDVVPPEIDGVLVDVQETGELKAG